MDKVFLSSLALGKIRGIFCLTLLLILASSAIKSTECNSSKNNNNNSDDKIPVIEKTSTNSRLKNVGPRHSIHRYQSQQQLMTNEEYERLSKSEQKAIDDNKSEEQQAKLVVPSKETDGNSQVVFVDFTRVVNEGAKNESTRLVGNNNEQLIKQNGQIACGETNPKGEPSMNVPSSDPIQNRIVGGTKAEAGEFPFQVRLNIRSRRGSSLCGGVIIDQRHILTAAHCMTTCSSYLVSTSSIEPSSVKATIGDLRITVPDGEQVVGIEKVTPHQQYSACSYSHNNYDIAILKTDKPMPWIFTRDGFGSVNRICLPHPYDEYQEGENVTVSGWGVMSEGDGMISNVLNSVNIPIVSLKECKTAYGQRVNKDHVCAGLKQGGKDSCQGDSGGPLFRRRGGQSELVGIVSFGYGCAQANTPGVYTKVSHYIDWIEKNL